MHVIVSNAIHVIRTAELTLPAAELTLLLALLTTCLVLRQARIGLIIAYVFTYRWGWVVLRGSNEGLRLAYLLFGGAIVILALVGLFNDTRIKN